MKHIKMMLYGEPGVGKSVFASKAPRPFFITTDGNYEWLEDFGAKPEDHLQVYSWNEAVKAFSESYDNYDTIVVDLVEDLFKWCEQEYCTRSKLEHVSDVGYGKGYDITRNEFFLEISKLIGKPKNIILLSHGITFETKDRRGVPHTKHAPSSRLPDKVLDMIEGRLRYCLRCYLKAEETEDGSLAKKRYLSLVPKENEFGIIRGVDENTIPHDIPLEWSEFARIVGLKNDSPKTQATDKNIQTSSIKEVKDVKPVEETTQSTGISVTDANPMPFDEPRDFETAQNINIVATEVETKVEEAKPAEQTSKPLTQEDRMAAIKAKLEAIKNSKK